MTRKDYELLADAINITKAYYIRTSVEAEANDVLLELTDQLAKMLNEQNPRFEVRRFQSACGFPK